MLVGSRSLTDKTLPASDLLASFAAAMGGLFAKCTQEEQQHSQAQGTAPQANDHDRAVLKLKVARDKVVKLKKKELVQTAFIVSDSVCASWTWRS